MKTFIEIIGYVIPILAGGFFLWLAFLNFGREKYPASLFFGGIAALFLLCSLPWFQGFAKTWFISNVNSKFKVLGEQVDAVQKTTGEMHGQLHDHQKQIDEHQKELDSVQGKIRTNQTEIAESQKQVTTTQTNLDQQQKKLEDVEYWVENLYSQMTSEIIAANDSNRAVILRTNDGGVHLMVKLKAAPIEGSLQVITSAPTIVGRGQQILPHKNRVTDRNVVFVSLWDYDLSQTGLTFQYVKDTRQTNLIQRIEVSDGEAVFDGQKTVVIFNKSNVTK